MAIYLVTGGCGFIGSNFVLQEIAKGNRIVNLDSLSYAAQPENLAGVSSRNYRFVEGDICNQALVSRLLDEEQPVAIVNFAAESHVDNSISGPGVFIHTNITGTYHLLEAARAYWNNNGRNPAFRFLHISTDEVFGELAFDENDIFTEGSPYKPNSPYSASKAASDHLVRAWHHTYGLPAIITNCSNNYGPHQHEEKLIPTMVRCALAGQTLPVYGKGENVRDWIYVEDHCRGIALALQKGRPGQSYCFGGRAEYRNIDLVHKICDLLDEFRPLQNGKSYRAQIGFVTDRPGHDTRYAINDDKARTELGYRPQRGFDENFRATIQWFLSRHAEKRAA